MSSELLGAAQNVLKGNLGGAWDINKGYADAYTDLGIARRFGGATAAYSLRDIGAMNGRVVRVRRDSDDAEEDFSANQVASGALETFVQAGADYSIFASEESAFRFLGQRSGGISASSDLTEFTLDVQTASGYAGAKFNADVTLGDSIYVSFNASLDEGSATASPKVGLRNIDSALNGTLYSNEGIIKEGFNSFKLTSTNSTASGIVWSEGDDNVIFSVTDIKVSTVSRNGFVETWYDQSANLRDAIQGTATNQPSIVQNGGIVTVNSKPAITFDGNDNFLEVDGTGSAEAYSFSPSGDFGMFIVYKASTGNIVDSRDAGGDGIFLQQSGSNTTRFRYNASANNIDVTATNDAQHFNTMTLDGTTLSGSVDGGTAVTKTVTVGVSTTQNLVLGAGFNQANATDGEIQEAIFYENNKTTDKANIEADIDNFYNIT